VRAVGGQPHDDSLPGVVARLTNDEPLDHRTRAGLVGRLALLLSKSGRQLVDAVIEIAPHIPVRDRVTLHSHFPGMSDEQIAGQLIAHAALATAAVGAAGGVLSTVELAAPPTLLSAPVQIVAETVAVVAVELKLVAELHELHGRAVAGTPAIRGAAYLGAWAGRRGFDPFGAGPSLSGVLGGAARLELRQRLIRRAGRNAASVIPLFAGAVAGASLNRRETQRLGRQILDDLRPGRGFRS